MKDIIADLERALSHLSAASDGLDNILISLKDLRQGLNNIHTGAADMKKLLWRTVDGNQLWLRGAMSRISQPKSLIQAMEPERTALISDSAFAEVLNWIKETEFPASYLGQGIIAFNTEEDVTCFLMRWS